MKYAIISNIGEVEVEAFKMIGLSTKRNNDSLIGRFGSGTKYSIAYLLKKGLKFRIFSGVNEIIFSVKDGEYRDTKYQTILINGFETSMTTDMGPDWKYWFCLREFYCNAIDEGEHNIMFINDNIDELNQVGTSLEMYGTEGSTRIYIEIPDTFSMDTWDSLFSEDRTSLYDGADENGKVYTIYARNSTKSGLLYHKGIRCITDDEVVNTIYDYSSHGFEINESRVINGTWGMRRQLGRILNTITDSIIIDTILRNIHKPCVEREAMIDNFKIVENTPWYTAIWDMPMVVEELAGRYLDTKDFETYVQIPHKICKKINEAMPGKRILGMMKSISSDTEFTEVADNEVPKRLQYIVESVLKDLKDNLKYYVGYPVKFFSSPWEESGSKRKIVLGYADMKNKIIYLNIHLTQYGKKDIALTIMEENEHLNSKASDETRDLQDYLFRMILSLMEEHNGFFF